MIHNIIIHTAPVCAELDRRRTGPATRVIVPIATIGDANAAPVMHGWSCDSDEAVAAFDADPVGPYG